MQFTRDSQPGLTSNPQRAPLAQLKEWCASLRTPDPSTEEQLATMCKTGAPQNVREVATCVRAISNETLPMKVRETALYTLLDANAFGRQRIFPSLAKLHSSELSAVVDVLETLLRSGVPVPSKDIHQLIHAAAQAQDPSWQMSEEFDRLVHRPLLRALNLSRMRETRVEHFDLIRSGAAEALQVDSLLRSTQHTPLSQPHRGLRSEFITTILSLLRESPSTEPGIRNILAQRRSLTTLPVTIGNELRQVDLHFGDVDLILRAAEEAYGGPLILALPEKQS